MGSVVNVLGEGLWLSGVSGGCVRRRSVVQIVSVVDVLEKGVWLSSVSGGCVRRRTVAQWGQWWMC